MIFFCIYSFHEIVMKIFVIPLHRNIQMQKNLELRKKGKILDFLQQTFICKLDIKYNKLRINIQIAVERGI